MLHSTLKFSIHIFFSLILTISINIYSQDLEGDYVGQTPPGNTPEIFAPDIISTEAHEHSSPTFSADGNEVYWSVWSLPVGEHPQTIMCMKRIDNKWTAPEVATFSGTFTDGGPFLSIDGERLYFYSTRPLQGSDEKDNDIWYVERKDTLWSDPVNIGTPINSDELEAMPAISENNNLYFIAYYEGVQGEYGIYKSLYTGSNYEQPEPLNESINSNYYDWCPFIAADESYLIFSSSRTGGYGSFDLYICFKNPDSSWSDQINMGNKINTSKQERFPSVTPDGQYLFFTRETPTNQDDIFWISASIIDTLRQQITSIKNEENIVPNEMKLNQNYPNPFNPSTIIKYSLQKPNHTTLKVYNLVGQELEKLVNEFQTVGEYEIIWQPKEFPSGIYFYRLQAGEYTETKKLILHK
ncbi:MAG: T9SS type A sorting domain-containing protein [Candidatus Hodarchaeota archaeon]